MQPFWSESLNFFLTNISPLCSYYSSESSSYTAEESEPKSVDTSLEYNEDIKILESTPEKAPSGTVVQSKEIATEVQLKENTKEVQPQRNTKELQLQQNAKELQSQQKELQSQQKELESQENARKEEHEDSQDNSKLEIAKVDTKSIPDVIEAVESTPEKTVPVSSTAGTSSEETTSNDKVDNKKYTEQNTIQSPDTLSLKSDSIEKKPSTQDSSEVRNLPCIEVVEAKDIEAKAEERSITNDIKAKQNTSLTTNIEVKSIDNITESDSKATGSKVVSKKLKISPKMMKKQRASQGLPGEKKRATRSRSAISPRGYGYSMAVMHPEVPKQETPTIVSESDSHKNSPQGNSLDNIIDSLGEDSAVVEIKPVVDSKTESVQDNNTPTSKGKTKNFQAKKFRLDQITGKLSAQRQIEAEAAVQSPSAFQMTVSPSPPPLPTLPPAKEPSPKPTLTGQYPMDTNYNVPPPPLIYAPPPPRPPCCNNPHCQQHYPPPSRMTHPMHLTPTHLHPHSSGGYVMYPPGHGPPAYETRPPLACKYGLFHNPHTLISKKVLG